MFFSIILRMLVFPYLVEPVIRKCDTSDENGFFRKRSIFRIADRLFPRYLARSRHWLVKAHTSDVDEDSLEEERKFISENPHEDWAREIFEMTGI